MAAAETMTGMLHPSLRPLLRAVQDLRLYADSKTAVDLVLRRDPEEVARLAGEALPGLLAAAPASSSPSSPRSAVSREALAAFLAEHTDPPGSDLEPHTPQDWRPDPPALRHLGPRPAVGAAAAESAAAAVPNLAPLLTDAERAAVHDLARTTVHGRWRVLCRRWKGGADDVGGGDERRRLARRSSLLPLPEPQMVPGDRFREAYYWDSYWVVRGLLASGMLETAAGTVRNLVAMADATAAAAAAAAGGDGSGGTSSSPSSSLPGGHVPNGARCYYLNRSQPPLLAPMARAVAEALLSRGDDDDNAKAAADELLRRCLPAIERELKHWRSFPKHVQCVPADSTLESPSTATAHALARYWAQWQGPRPESQREDEATAAELDGGAAAPVATITTTTTTDPDRLGRRLMRDLASAAESGWDFSTRWMPPGASLEAAAAGAADDGSSNKTAAAPPSPSLASLRTTRVIPADLNALLYRAERDAAWAARRLGEQGRAARLEGLARQRARAMRSLLWDERAACWRDGWMVRKRRQGGDEAGAGSDDDNDGGAFPALEDDEEEDDDQERPWVVRRSPGVYASNYIPLWCGLLDDDDDDDEQEDDEPPTGEGKQQQPKGAATTTADRVALSLLASGLLQPGGVAASLYASGQQWDWPNAWPPLQHALAEACAKEERSPRARAVGLAVAAAYARAVLQGWGGGGGSGNGGELHEKYDARGGGREGRGGEYAPQVGFGWTNGALLALLAAGLV